MSLSFNHVYKLAHELEDYQRSRSHHHHFDCRSETTQLRNNVHHGIVIVCEYSHLPVEVKSHIDGVLALVFESLQILPTLLNLFLHKDTNLTVSHVDII